MIATIALATTLNISGAYYESRNCSLKAGPCHYSGEVMTDGDTAVMVYRFDKGSFAGTSLRGSAAAVVVTAQRNFAFESERRATLYLDGSPAQVAALGKLYAAKLAASFGKQLRTSSAKITSASENGGVRVRVGANYELQTSERECLACSMPGTVWFEPLGPGVEASVATVEMQKLIEPSLDQNWTRRDETGAFVGRFNW
ncbi:MAG: DUF1326 domain-containing protein [Fimbriimonadales bacterium]